MFGFGNPYEQTAVRDLYEQIGKKALQNPDPHGHAWGKELFELKAEILALREDVALLRAELRK